MIAFCAACQKDTEHQMTTVGSEVVLVCSGSRQRTEEEAIADVPSGVVEAGLAEEFIAKAGLLSPARACLRSLKFPKDVSLPEVLAKHKAANVR